MKPQVLIRIIGLVMVVVIYVKRIVIRMIMMLRVFVLMVQMVLQSCMRVLMTVVRILHLDWVQTTVVQPQLERYVLIDFVCFCVCAIHIPL